MKNESNLSIRVELPSFTSNDKTDRFVVMRTKQELNKLLSKYNDMISVNTVGNGIIQIIGNDLMKNKAISLKEIQDKIANYSFKYAVVIPTIDTNYDETLENLLLDDYTFSFN